MCPLPVLPGPYEVLCRPCRLLNLPRPGGRAERERRGGGPYRADRLRLSPEGGNKAEGGNNNVFVSLLDDVAKRRQPVPEVQSEYDSRRRLALLIPPWVSSCRRLWRGNAEAPSGCVHPLCFPQS